MRSVKRIAKRVASSHCEQQAFESIGYAVQYPKTKEEVTTLFDVLQGSKPLYTAQTLLPDEKSLQRLDENASNSNWATAKPWCEW